MTAAPDPLVVPPPDLDLDRLQATLASRWALDGGLVAVHGERDRNFRVDAPTACYLLKVHNPADGESVIDLQTSALRHVAAVDAGLPVPSVVATVDGRSWTEVGGRDGRRSLAWVSTWLPGRHPRSTDLDAPRLFAWGGTAARLARALRGFVHPAAGYPIAWDVRRLPELRGWLEAVEPAHQPAVEAVLNRFEQRVGPRLPGLRAQVLHNDFAPGNVLVDDSFRVTGVTDFGDLTHTSLVCDLAVACADVLTTHERALDLVGEVVAGYDAVTPLEPDELALVADLVAGRYAASVLITAWRTREQGWAPELDEVAHRQLEVMLAHGLDVLTDGIRDRVAGQRAAPAEQPAKGHRPTDRLLRDRARVLGPQSLSYEQPLHLVSGQGVFLHAADGRRYLDAYNNVPVLGHSHPAVTEAVAAQLARLNTNSRYLQQLPVELAERLLATLPDRFDRVLLVSSGSEANDLAWRIARHATGACGGVATRWAYHGITEATFAFSPEGWRDAVPPAWMRLVDPPPAASQVSDAVAGLAASGEGTAAMLVDGVFTSDGVHGPAHDWTRGAAAAVHAAGGLYVADEVQAGHGRTGDGLWSFVAGDVPADLVTLGKPMGNGYPVAAVVGPAELVDPFVEGTDYFSTFGGASAACAAALAVLRTLEEERIVEHVAAVGERLRSELAAAGAELEAVSAVRGWGLALGVDVVDPATGRPDVERARRVVEGVRERGVLIGRTGRDGATLKIRPPLVLGHEHVDQLVTTLAEVLTLPAPPSR